MIIDWAALGHPHYKSMSDGQTIAYISDIGAFGLQPLFETGCVITGSLLLISFICERWLRHNGKLARNTSTTQKVLSVISIIAAAAGSGGLMTLSFNNDYYHQNLHDGMLLLFIAGYIISAICLCAEYQRLGIHYRNHKVLRMSFWIKLAFIIIEGILAIGFAATFSHHENIAAGFEWTIAFIFTFYILSFVLDLLPSIHHGEHLPQGVRQAMMEEKNRNDVETGRNDSGQNQNYPGNDYPADNSDLGRQKKRGFGSMFYHKTTTSQ